mmetsp:Transcript_10699/g.33110  ORF Transcript_10699/g.33110 Transcript_10699/m.33110 type:complete len:242 (+) Transcript_10699:696-1421(+)
MAVELRGWGRTAGEVLRAGQEDKREVAVTRGDLQIVHEAPRLRHEGQLRALGPGGVQPPGPRRPQRIQAAAVGRGRGRGLCAALRGKRAEVFPPDSVNPGVHGPRRQLRCGVRQALGRQHDVGRQGRPLALVVFRILHQLRQACGQGLAESTPNGPPQQRCSGDRCWCSEPVCRHSLFHRLNLSLPLPLLLCLARQPCQAHHGTGACVAVGLAGEQRVAAAAAEGLPQRGPLRGGVQRRGL